MLKISNLKIPAKTHDAMLEMSVADMLGVPVSEIRALRILKRSVDARHKSGVLFVYTVTVDVDDEAAVLKNAPKNVTVYAPPALYAFPYAGQTSNTPPVVVGLGPAGLFAALCLAEAGLRPVILERGAPIEQRVHDVEQFWQTGKLDIHSNVQFGEGGAGTFSDGKLTTGVKDARIPYIIERLIDFGAPDDIRYLSKPHIGTDRLRRVVVAARKALTALGCDIRFGHRLSDITQNADGLLTLHVDSSDGAYTLDISRIVLAPGNAARDTFAMLDRRGIQLSAKNFSVGVRIEHRQSDIDAAQYGKASTIGTLPASDYKLAAHLKSGRSVYTFCVCPGGHVVAAASETDGLVTNGMSYYARDEVNCNGGLLVSVTPDDFDGTLGGIALQRQLEQSAFTAGGGDFYAPAQLVGDFLSKTSSTGPRTVIPTYRPGVRWCNLWDVLPEFVCQSIADALPVLGHRVRGFDAADAVLTAVETRSSSPVRIDREDARSISCPGLYPCGEGAGYAGGIMSAAVDGIRAAEAVCASLETP